MLDIPVPLNRKMTNSKTKITVIIAAYNEEQAIGQVVLGFKQELERSSYPFEILVVDNNSIDNTSKVATTAGATVIKEELQGYGYACMKGLTEAQGEYIILTEGDKTFEPSDIWKLLVYAQAYENKWFAQWFADAKSSADRSRIVYNTYCLLSVLKMCIQIAPELTQNATVSALK